MNKHPQYEEVFQSKWGECMNQESTLHWKGIEEKYIIHRKSSLPGLWLQGLLLKYKHKAKRTDSRQPRGQDQRGPMGGISMTPRKVTTQVGIKENLL